MDTISKKHRTLKSIKKVAGDLPVFKSVKFWLRSRREKKLLRKWERDGKPLPPPHQVKEHAIRNYAKEYKLRVLVETGTYRGEMVQKMLNYFEKIYSIELDSDLFLRAKEMFREQDKVKIIHGDSAVELRNLVMELDQPALFWLDGHFSGGCTAKGEKNTPVVEELTHICDAGESRNVILIDDARFFGAGADYPSFDELNDMIKMKIGDASFRVEDDIIRVAPHKMAG